MGSYLTCIDSLQNVDVIFVLGGSAYDRGNEAAKIYHQGYAKYIVTTSGNIPDDLKALGIEYYESEITRLGILKNDVPDSCVLALKEATSTKEEAEVILKFCKTYEVRSCIILSSIFHTRRVKSVFSKLLESEGIKVIIRGAPSSIYNENKWWRYEQGMIMVNNEYVKLLYYALKY